MGTAFTISPQTLNDLYRPRTVEPSGLQKAAQMAHRIAYAVETGWGTMPEKLQGRLRDLAYALIEPPKGIRGALSRTVGHAILAVFALRGQTDVLYEYLTAVHRLVHAVLSAVEKDSPQYREQLVGALDQAVRDSDKIAPLDPENIRGWLSSVSDQAH